MTVTFSKRLSDAIRRTSTPVLVGLDPRIDQLPKKLQPLDISDLAAVAAAYRLFCERIIDVVAPLVPAVKPQAAFFEELGPHGMVALHQVVQYARARGLLVILDGKRNDIGTTAEAYARGFLGEKSAWGADALTVSPYLGDDSLTPFCQVAESTGAGIFVLVKTSNPGGKTFQDLKFDGKSLYSRVAELVENLSCASLASAPSTNGQTDRYGAIGAVVGATYPEQLAELRTLMPHTWFLVPGFGAQGGTAKDVAAAFDGEGLGAIVNNSRGIIFAHRAAAYRDRFGEARWEDAVDCATRDMIAQLRDVSSQGR